MLFRVGQKVRLLHQSGEGVVTALIDKDHIEVDMGDNFAVDMHISEVVPVDSSEPQFTDSKKKADSVPAIHRTFDPSMVDLSLVVIRKDDKNLEFILANPEPVEILFTCYQQSLKNYTGISAGQVERGSYTSLFVLPKDQAIQMKGIYFQILAFSPGKGYPHTLETVEYPWSRGSIAQPSKHIPAFKNDGWVFSLRENQLKKDISAIADSEFVRIKRTEAPPKRAEAEVDLHIEMLVKNPFELAPSEMLQYQIRHLEQKLSTALTENYASLVIIHGVGEGKLRKAVKDILSKTPHIKSFESADPVRYGNGATKVIFK
ncbi:MAG: Smr/MutS family protein [Bacteroidia bacterium]|nr:Smr/MutS family protein [Bacteroidia bacterium]